MNNAHSPTARSGSSLDARARGRARRADYILCSTADQPLAVVEAKPFDQPAEDGVEQALQYAAMLGLTFAYAANGRDILEMDLSTGGAATRVNSFPTPQQLWDRKCAAEDISADARPHIPAPTYPSPGKRLRYYQEIALLRAVQALANGRDRALLTLCTGAGKTPIAFQISWKLWSSAWNRQGDGRRSRMLFLADRNGLVDDPMAKDSAPFGDARWKIEGGQAPTSRDMYFATYQAVAEDAQREGLFRQYPRDFFDLVVIDKCHRGSSRDNSSWRRILDWFSPAAQLGLRERVGARAPSTFKFAPCPPGSNAGLMSARGVRHQDVLGPASKFTARGRHGGSCGQRRSILR